MITWCEMGGEPIGFFATTPRLIGMVVEGRARARQHDFKLTAWLAHTIESLQRAKRIPALSKMIGGGDVTRRNASTGSAEDLLSTVRRWNVAIAAARPSDAR